MINYTKIDRAVEDCCNAMDNIVEHSDFIGCTLRRVFNDTERYSDEVVIAWGCWTEQELNVVITPKIDLVSLAY